MLYARGSDVPTALSGYSCSSITDADVSRIVVLEQLRVLDLGGCLSITGSGFVARMTTRVQCMAAHDFDEFDDEPCCCCCKPIEHIVSPLGTCTTWHLLAARISQTACRMLPICTCDNWTAHDVTPVALAWLAAQGLVNCCRAAPKVQMLHFEIG